MKNLKKFFVAFIAVSFCSGILTSCDPDEIDAFAQGYRDGYYSTRADASDDGQAVEETATFESVTE